MAVRPDNALFQRMLDVRATLATLERDLYAAGAKESAQLVGRAGREFDSSNYAGELNTRGIQHALR